MQYKLLKVKLLGETGILGAFSGGLLDHLPETPPEVTFFPMVWVSPPPPRAAQPTLAITVFKGVVNSLTGIPF